MTHPNYTEPNYLSQFFQYDHLPDHLQSISKSFANLAEIVDISSATDNPEKAMALRKLLEAKDCAVRAVLLDDR